MIALHDESEVNPEQCQVSKKKEEEKVGEFPAQPLAWSAIPSPEHGLSEVTPERPFIEMVHLAESEITRGPEGRGWISCDARCQTTPGYFRRKLRRVTTSSAQIEI